MATNTVDIVRAFYEHYARGDIDSATQEFADDARWHNPEAQQLPFPGDHRGKRAVKEVLADAAGDWEVFRITPTDVVAQGNSVVVVSSATAKARQTGKAVKLPLIHVWKIGGDQVKSVLALTDTALAADALGTL